MTRLERFHSSFSPTPFSLFPALDHIGGERNGGLSSDTYDYFFSSTSTGNSTPVDFIQQRRFHDSCNIYTIFQLVMIDNSTISNWHTSCYPPTCPVIFGVTMRKQQTIRNAVLCSGVGLHTG